MYPNYDHFNQNAQLHVDLRPWVIKTFSWIFVSKAQVSLSIYLYYCHFIHSLENWNSKGHCSAIFLCSFLSSSNYLIFRQTWRVSKLFLHKIVTLSCCLLKHLVLLLVRCLPHISVIKPSGQAIHTIFIFSIKFSFICIAPFYNKNVSRCIVRNPKPEPPGKHSSKEKLPFNRKKRFNNGGTTSSPLLLL